MIIAVDWDAKHQFKQTNKQIISNTMFKTTFFAWYIFTAYSVDTTGIIVCFTAVHAFISITEHGENIYWLTLFHFIRMSKFTP